MIDVNVNVNIELKQELEYPVQADSRPSRAPGSPIDLQY